MRFIAIIPLCLGLIASCLAAPSQPKSDNKATEMLAKNVMPEALLKIAPESDMKGGLQEKANLQSVENFQSIDAKITPNPTGRSLEFPGFGIAPITDLSFLSSVKDNEQFLALLKNDPNFLQFPKGDSNALPLPKGDSKSIISTDNSNLLPFLKTNTDFSSLFKSEANSAALPKADTNFPSFFNGIPNFTPSLKIDGNSPSLPKGDVNLSPFPKGEADFSFLTKTTAGSPFLPEGNFDFEQFLKENPDVFSLPKSDSKSPAMPKDAENSPAMPKSTEQSPAIQKINADVPSVPKTDADFTPQIHAAFLPFLAANADFLSLTKANAKSPALLKGVEDFAAFANINFPSLPKTDAAFSPFLAGNSDFSLPKADAKSPAMPKDAEKSPAVTKISSELPSLPKSDAGNLPKIDANLLPFLKGNAELPLPKADAKTAELPKGDANFSPFPNFLPKTDSSFPSLSKGDVNFPSFLPKIGESSLPAGAVDLSQFLKGNADFQSLFNNNANPLLFPNGDASLLPSPKENSDFLSSMKRENLKMAPVSLPQALPDVASEQQRQADPMPEQVKETPEVAAARQAHFQAVAEATRAAANPEAMMPAEPKYTPEVQAAREAHFRAYAIAAKLAAESDVNPKILEQLLGRPGEPKLGAQKIEGLESFMLSPQFLEEVKRLMGTVRNNQPDMENSAAKTDAPIMNFPQTSDSRGTINLAEKPQLKMPIQPVEANIQSTGIIQPSTSLGATDSRLSSLDEFEQSKMKAEINLAASTDLKIKPSEAQRYVIVRSGERVPLTSAVQTVTDQISRWKNLAIQYMAV